MKLYTEEQLKEAIKLARECDSDCWGVDFHNGNTDEIIEELTPIQLPSFDDIEKQSFESLALNTAIIGFQVGAKWVKEQILNQNK